MTVRALAHAIVSRYPQAWRERYEAEVRGLIDDTHVQFRDLGELLRGLFTETARELLMSEDRPRRTARAAWLATVGGGAVFVAVAGLTGIALAKLTGPWLDSIAYIAFAVFIVLLLAIARLMASGWKRREPGRPLNTPPDVAMRVLPSAFVATVLYGAFMANAESPTPSSIPSWFSFSYNWVSMWLFAGTQIASFFPGKELLETLEKVSFAESQILANEKWVEGCRDMISKGVPSPLNDALQQVGKWTVERDIARARLKALGYRARFRGSVGGADAQENAQ